MISKEEYLRKIKNTTFYRYSDEDEQENILKDAEKKWEKRYGKKIKHNHFKQKRFNKRKYKKGMNNYEL